MFNVVYNNIQKITNISIKKPIILISILNKYLDMSIYLDNRIPLMHTYVHTYIHTYISYMQHCTQAGRLEAGA